MEVQGRWRGGRLKRRWLDRVRDDIKEKELSGEEVYNQTSWRCISSNIDHTKKWELNEGQEDNSARISGFRDKNTRAHIIMNSVRPPEHIAEYRTSCTE